MQRLSPRAADLVSRLERAPTVRERLAGRADAELAVLAELRAAPEPAVVPHLLALVFGGTQLVARAAADVVREAIAASAPADLVQLEDACRRAGAYAIAAPGWYTLTPIDVSRLARLGGAGTAAVGVASFHASGYVREAAVTELDTVTDGAELPFLLLRLNDWVDAVAQRARAAVERRIVPACADAFVDGLPILLRLAARTRRPHADLLDRVYAFLRAPEQHAALLRGLDAVDRTTRRAGFRLAREATVAEPRPLVERALRDPDTVIRLQAAGAARRTFTAAHLVPLLPTLAADPFPAVRREGLAAVAERAPLHAEPWLRAALLDQSAGVREAARFYLRRGGVVSDFARFYRERVGPESPGRVLAAALAGLGETGVPNDAVAAAACLTHERAAVRRAAVRALAALDADGSLERLASMLRDGAPSVSHAARDAVRPRAARVGAAALLDTLRTVAHAHGRVDALSVAAGLGKWESLPVLIEASADRDGRVREAAREHLGAWVAQQNRHSAEPTPAQLAAIHGALGAHHLALDRRTAGEIAAVLRFWSA